MQNRIIKSLIIIGAVLSTVGCQSMNHRFGTDSTVYADAKEAPLLKFPRGALLPSTRYDIPHVSGTNEQIISDPLPPDYEVPTVPCPPSNKV